MKKIRVGLSQKELEMMLHKGTPQIWREDGVEIEVFNEDME